MHAVIIDDERYSVKAIMENIHWETIGENGVEVKLFAILRCREATESI